MLEVIRYEIEDLHRFFVAWFTGAIEDSDQVFAAQFSSRFAPEFQMVAPSGARTKLPALANGLRSAHGSNPAFEIDIVDVSMVTASERVFVATYMERQRNAKNTHPPDNDRFSTAVFRKNDERLLWVHLQETGCRPSD
ncbi:MAG: hypothetical protein ACFB9M_09865 [Myxococcota bacterium]